MRRHQIITVALTAPFAFASLAACNGEREATAETAVADVEVTTEMPEGAVSDERLQAAADGAAVVASTRPPEVVVIQQPAEGAATTGSTTGSTAASTDAGQTSR